jgi:hypothetical protein
MKAHLSERDRDNGSVSLNINRLSSAIAVLTIAPLKLGSCLDSSNQVRVEQTR